MLIDPGVFEVCFTGWVGTLAPPVTPGEPEVVTMDGKTLRGSFDRGLAQLPPHRVSAWANAVWTTSPTRSRSELLDRLVLANTLVTLDAMGCQKDIA